MRKVGWLHLSDLHCGDESQSHRWPNVRQRFLDDLKVLHERSGPWNFVLFTGDLANRGTPAEYDRFGEIVEPVWRVLEALGPSPLLIPVPGNHDLRRPGAKNPAATLLAEWATRPEVREEFWSTPTSPYCSLVQEAFEPYSQWLARQALCSDPSFRGGILPGDFSVTVNCSDLSLGLLGLNTSFLHLSDSAVKGSLSVSLRQFHAACKPDGPAWAESHDVCLLLTHHPLDWLSSDALSEYQMEIATPGRFALHLCGHVHRRLDRNEAIGGAAPTRQRQGISLFGRESYGNGGEKRLHGYAAYSLEEHAGALLVRSWPRKASASPSAPWKLVPDYEAAAELLDDGGTPGDQVGRLPSPARVGHSSSSAARRRGTHPIDRRPPGMRPLGRKAGGKVRRQTVRDLEGAIHQVVRAEYLTAPYKEARHLTTVSPESFSRMFSLCATCADPSLLGPQMIASLADLIINSASPHPLRVAGVPGTGKSTLLTVLYGELRQRFLDGRSPLLPFYIDAHHYDWVIYGGVDLHLAQARAKCLVDLQPLRDLLEQFPEQEVAIILDGVDENVKFEHSIERIVIGLLEAHRPHKKVVGVGLSGEETDRSLEQKLAFLGPPLQEVRLTQMGIGDAKAQGFVELFLELCPDEDPALTPSVALARLAELRVGVLDLFTLAVLSRPNPDYRRETTLAGLLVRYCQDFLTRKSPNAAPAPGLSDAAALAYRYAIKKEAFESAELLDNPCWLLLHRHLYIRDFLVAYALVDDLAQPPTDRSEGPRDRIFPYRIMRFVRELANRHEATTHLLLAGAEDLFLGGGFECKANTAYLLGRLDSIPARQASTKLLTGIRESLGGDKIEEVQTSSTPQKVFLHRTVLISLAELGDANAEASYLRLLLESTEWDRLNRGFHLSYYEDKPFSPLLAEGDYEDPLGECQNTWDALEKKILGTQRKPAYPLFDADVVTLLSLAQHRHASGRLDSPTRTRARTVTEHVQLPGLLRYQAVVPFVAMIDAHLRVTGFRPAQVLVELLGLKDQKRTGWLERGIANCESVADHTFGVCLLAEALLPESMPDQAGYSKAEVIRIALAHDLGEAYTGDRPNKTEEDSAVEAEKFAYIRSCGTYAALRPLTEIADRWRRFEELRDINAMIARDLDRIEALVQMRQYQAAGWEIRGALKWHRTTVRGLYTEIGKQILALIDELQEGDR